MADLIDIKRTEAGWQLPLSGAEVTQLRFDYAVTLVLGDTFDLRIEGVFDLARVSGEPQTVDPEGPPDQLNPALWLSRAEIDSATASDAGTLDVVFSTGMTISVPPDEQYEAWQLAGPDGLLVVSTPGGSLAIWHPTTGG